MYTYLYNIVIHFCLGYQSVHTIMHFHYFSASANYNIVAVPSILVGREEFVVVLGPVFRLADKSSHGGECDSALADGHILSPVVLKQQPFPLVLQGEPTLLLGRWCQICSN